VPVSHYRPLPHHWIYRESAEALDRTRAAVGTWLHARPRDWLAQVAAVALDPWRGNTSALVAPLGHPPWWWTTSHAIRLANLVVDQVRRRLQQATLGIGAVSVIRCTASASCC
jgi:transposase